MYRSILVPLDGSPLSEQALPYATALARRTGAALRLAYVSRPLVLVEGVMYFGAPAVQLWDEEKTYIHNLVERLKAAGLADVSGQVLEGPIAEALQEHALGQHCDLVVMTTHGRGPVSRFWLGSVADQLIHRLPIPLLLIRTREGAPPAGEPAVANVLVALDGTAAAEQILGPAGELAKALRGTLTLLRVVPAAAPGGPSKPAAEALAAADRARADAHVYLQRMAAALRERGIAAGTRILSHPHPAAAILDESADGAYGLLALETHGRRGLPRLFLGSVADKVVRGASVPVLLHRCLPD